MDKKRILKSLVKGAKKVVTAPWKLGEKIGSSLPNIVVNPKATMDGWMADQQKIQIKRNRLF